MLTIIGERVVLREFAKVNLYDKEYYKWLRDIEVINELYKMEYLLSINFDIIESYILDLLESKNDCFFAVYTKESNIFIGTVKLGHIDWRASICDIGIMIGDKNFRGMGLSREIIQLASSYAFDKLSIRKITAGTSQKNVPMQKCFEGLGFSKDGQLRKHLLIDGDFCDHLLYSLFKSEIKK
ncbi:GNAT family N-acetyltransferase [Aquirufa antheringensis]|uniref:GNAT family N-acetyltransferase n=1 Tax=Aquirufa antheringensis TaxID=2516559 RepID=UPI0022A98420|nr:GNAT family protein [Aquirufa antheringensis]MCZ2484747.1 GNAT family N-acetyltransferase [Aquirufa antheringensis]